MFIGRLFSWAKNVPMKVSNMRESIARFIIPDVGPSNSLQNPQQCETRNVSTQFPEPQNTKYSESGTLTETILFRESSKPRVNKKPTASAPIPVPVLPPPIEELPPAEPIQYDYMIEINKKSPKGDKVVPNGTIVFKSPDRRVAVMFTGPRLPMIESDTGVIEESDIAEPVTESAKPELAPAVEAKGTFIFI